MNNTILVLSQVSYNSGFSYFLVHLTKYLPALTVFAVLDSPDIFYFPDTLVVFQPLKYSSGSL